MKRVLFCNFLLAYLFLQIPEPLLHAQWARTGGPGGGRINLVEIGSTVTLAGTPEGVFRSIDGARTWCQSGLQSQNVTALLSSEAGWFVGTRGGFLFHSTDDGISWASVPIDSVSAISSLLYMSGRLLVGVGGPFSPLFGDGVYCTTDLGNSWDYIEQIGTWWEGITDMLVMDSLLVVSAPGVGLYFSTDAGDTWRKDSSSAVGGMRFLAHRGSTLFACSGARLSRSTDQGLSWIQVGGTIPRHVSEFWSLGANSTSVFVGTHGALYRSSDDGDTWSVANTGLTCTRYLNSIEAADTLVLVCSKRGGIHRSTDDGLSWSPASSGINKGYVFALHEDNGVVFAGTFAGVHRSLDGGLTWQYSGLINETYALAFESGGLFAAGEEGVYRSMDGGLTWVECSLLPSSAVLSLTVQGGSLIAVAYSHAYRSADWGDTWLGADSGLAATDRGLKWLASTGEKVYCGVDRAGGSALYSSTNSGRTWQPESLPAGTFGSYFDALAVGGNEIYAAGRCNGVHISRDSGMTWSHPLSGLPYRCVDYLFPIGDVLCNVTPDSGVFLLRGLDTVWTPFRDGLEYAAEHYTMAATDDWLLLGTQGQGVWRRPVSELVGVREEPRTPSHYMLAQNYPNPFNPTTTIDYGISVGTYGRTSLQVFDLLGREITTLVNEVKEPGTYTVRWDAGGVSSGVYFYRIRTGSFVQTKRMMLLR